MLGLLTQCCLSAQGTHLTPSCILYQEQSCSMHHGSTGHLIHLCKPNAFPLCITTAVPLRVKFACLINKASPPQDITCAWGSISKCELFPRRYVASSDQSHVRCGSTSCTHHKELQVPAITTAEHQSFQVCVEGLFLRQAQTTYIDSM